MNDLFQTKSFSQIGILSYLKGKDKELIIKKFKQQAGKLTNKRKYEIRQKILSSSKMINTQLVENKLQITLEHLEYVYKDELDAVCLDTCKDYHQFHIKYVAEKISQNGEFKCPDCRINCESTAEIILNSFVASYFDKINNYVGSTLILKRQKIGSMYKKDSQATAIQTQQKTIVPNLADDGSFYIKTLSILQIENNDERLKNLNIEQIASKIQQIQSEQKSLQFQQRELKNTNNQILINLICFKSIVRIRNPLIHKLCKPADHKNRLILYSYEQIYSSLFDQKKKKKKIRCIYPNCPNYFDQQNFFDNAVIVENIKKLIYEEYKECVLGSYFSGMYHKNWHFNYSQTMLLKNEKNRQLVKRYMNSIRQQIQSLLGCVNLAVKRRIYRSISDDFENERQLDASIKMIALGQQKPSIIVVDLDQSNIFPVRCSNCKNLNSKDIYKMLFLNKSSAQKICSICNAEIEKKKSIYQIFFVDLKLMEFIFLEGHNQEVYYDIKNKKYFHKLTYYTGRSMRQKCKQENKLCKQNFYMSQMDITKNKNIRYIPFIDYRCSKDVEGKPEELNKHFIYIGENDKFKEDNCPQCNRQIRSDTLEYIQQLEILLRKNGNALRWLPKAANQIFNNNPAIISLKYYNDIPNQYKIREEIKNLTIYWRNDQGTLIRFPIIFKSCTHPLETTICDFSDILYQSRVHKLTKFQCRWKQCKNQYSQASDIQRVSLDIYSKIQESPQINRRIITNNQYWINYNIEDGIINKTSKKYSEDNTDIKQLEILSNYRNKFLNSLQEISTRKQIYEKLKRIQEQIKYDKQKIEQDENLFKKQSKYKHSQNEMQFMQLKQNLQRNQQKRKELKDKKEQMMAQEREQNRKANKTNNINFNKLRQNYKPHVSNLKQKSSYEEVGENIQQQTFANFKTFGNLCPFKYPVPKIIKQDQLINQFILKSSK